MNRFFRPLLLLFCLFLTIQRAKGATWYVATNGDDAAEGTNWATAKQTIQAAIDLAVSNDTVLVSNGVYNAGGVTNYPFGTALTNRVAIYKPIAVCSVNGPSATVIEGASDPLTTCGVSSVRCIYMTGNSSLVGFTLTNGTTQRGTPLTGKSDGGGIWCENRSVIISNCVVSGNSAAWYGGGVIFGTLYNCTLSGNSADCGGGAYASTLYNCILSSNVAAYGGGGAWLSKLYNCTLAGNLATNGGGVLSCTLYDCTLSGNSAIVGGGADGDKLYDCVLTGNMGNSGGGACNASLYRCLLTDNVATSGGGSCACDLFSCSLFGNSARYGGGAYGGTLYSCVLATNSATDGGGTFGGTPKSCVLIGNAAFRWGGGSFQSTLYNCVLRGNSAASDGGGTYMGSMKNCTLVANSAEGSGGGVYYNTTVQNCIIYSNTAPVGPNSLGIQCYYCCVEPDPGGTGNITNDPQFVNEANGDFRLQARSPCIDAGENSYAWGTNDVDCNPRIVHGVVDMGAYEFQGYWAWAGGITNGLTNSDDCATGDGYPNLLKYATGSCPTNSDELARLLGGHGSGPFSLFNRNTNAMDVTLIVEGADAISNGAAWNGIATNINGSWGGATNVAESGTTNPVRVTVQDSDPDLRTNRFIRLRVSRP